MSALTPSSHRQPDRSGSETGLAWALWLPPEAEPPHPGVVICHGAGSCKENHADFARLASGAGWAAIAFDARGHGESDGAMGPEAVDDVIRIAALLAQRDDVDERRLIARGSSMGGFLAIHAVAAGATLAGAIAICPAGEEHLLRGLREDRLEMRIDDPAALEAWLIEAGLGESVEMIGARPLIILHAEGDESIPYAFSEQLHECGRDPRRLIIAPGGDHRSVQHDAELGAVALGWVERELDHGRGAGT